MHNKRVLIGMSGGVDSSVAAALIVEHGYEVIGVTLKLYDYSQFGFDPPDGGCCGIDLIDDARLACANLKIPHYVMDFRKSFQKHVIENFIHSYSVGLTPNPCVDCNVHIKWAEMLGAADRLGCNFVATGHYAKIDHSSSYPRLYRAVDRSKDQSYVLWGIPEAALSRTILPLGEIRKSETRAMAKRYGFRNADRPDSQEICFIPEGDYSHIIKKRLGRDDPSLKKGPIYDVNGATIGEHKGYANYTIGQRRGIGLSSDTPLYVTRINPGDRSIVVGKERHLFESKFSATGLNFLIPENEMPSRVTVKIRYRHHDRPATLTIDGRNAIVTFDEAQRAITPGQSAVFYSSDQLIGGGIIEKVIPQL